jgi:hypothetical protein
MVCMTLRWREMDSNFRFRVRCKSGLKAIIAGFGCQPPSPDYLRLLSADITEGGPKRSLGTEALSRAEPEVRIHLPPAKSRANSSTDVEATRIQAGDLILGRRCAVGHWDGNGPRPHG